MLSKQNVIPRSARSVVPLVREGKSKAERSPTHRVDKVNECSREEESRRKEKVEERRRRKKKEERRKKKDVEQIERLSVRPSVSQSFSQLVSQKNEYGSGRRLSAGPMRKYSPQISTVSGVAGKRT